jgi:hypothetical protein
MKKPKMDTPAQMFKAKFANETSRMNEVTENERCDECMSKNHRASVMVTASGTADL